MGKLRSRLSSMFANAARDIASLSEIPAMRYNLRERYSLISARRSHKRQSSFLGFQVNYLDEFSYKFALQEIFFSGEYRFEGATDTPVILDCGANIGLATLFFKYLYPKAIITAFEADPTTSSILKENVAQNRLKNVKVHNLMLSNSEGNHKFYTDANRAGVLVGSVDANRISNSCEIVVPAGKLSTYIDGPVDLLKLDVEGSEFDVLADLKNSGKLPQIRQMIIEYHHKIGDKRSCLAAFLAQLEDAGFEYQVGGADCEPITRQNVYQDILLGVYRARLD